VAVALPIFQALGHVQAVVLPGLVELTRLIAHHPSLWSCLPNSNDNQKPNYAYTKSYRDLKKEIHHRPSPIPALWRRSITGWSFGNKQHRRGVIHLGDFLEAIFCSIGTGAESHWRKLPGYHGAVFIPAHRPIHRPGDKTLATTNLAIVFGVLMGVQSPGVKGILIFGVALPDL
jgi:hypothetical protein